jgi:hypothetical protein
MLNLAMDFNNGLEKLLTCISLVLGFHGSQAEEKKPRQS